MNTSPIKAYLVYRDEMDNEIYNFINYKCSQCPKIAKKAQLLQSANRGHLISLKVAEQWLWRLEIDRMEALNQ